MFLVCYTTGGGAGGGLLIAQSNVPARMRERLAKLSGDIAALEPDSGPACLDSLLLVLRDCFDAGRASLIHCTPDLTPTLLRVSTETPIPVGSEYIKPLIWEQAWRSGPLFVDDISLHPEFISPWSDSYRTGAFLAIAIKVGSKLHGAVYVSDVDPNIVREVRACEQELTLPLAQIGQFVAFWTRLQLHAQNGGAPDLSVSVLFDKIGRSAGAIEALTHFAEHVSEWCDIQLIAAIHDGCGSASSGMTHARSAGLHCQIEAAYCALSEQWGRRCPKSLAPPFDAVKCTGVDSTHGEPTVTATDLHMETIPVFLDNGLFALVSFGIPESARPNRPQLQAMADLLQQVFVHVKKNLLLEQTRQLSTADDLTGLHNDRQFSALAEREVDRAQRYNVPLSLLFLDVDHFKDINDAYSFETGDVVLREIARIIAENIRTTDLASRYSGERFAVMLPDSPYRQAELLADRLRRYIENFSFFIPNSQLFLKVTASVGVASYLEHNPAGLGQLIEFADTALYFAKHNGRNQVIGYSYVLNLMIGDTQHRG